MERRWHGKFFPAVRMGTTIRIPREELIQWIKNGGINKYKEEVARADTEYEEQKRRSLGMAAEGGVQHPERSD